MDTKALRKFSYGVYLLTAVDDHGKDVGCVVNTGMQLTSKPYRVMVAVNHDNVTYQAIKRTRRFALTALSQDATIELIGRFGFQHSDAQDKFAGLDVARTASGLPYVRTSATSAVECEVASALDVGSHEVFVGEVTDALVIDPQATPLTYAYYHDVLRGTTPPAASAFIADEPAGTGKGAGDAGSATASAAEQPAAGGQDGPAPVMHHFKCNLCGYIHETPDEELPEDFRCPMCGAPASMFTKID
jgi:flavin reductase (DIM6/NTAB) family NADH-FMN oxidoreductase RutF/rubredoxin